MTTIHQESLEIAVSEMLDGRAASEFDTFEEFWEELDALFWYDAQDAGESCSADKEEFEAIFNSLKNAESNPITQEI